MESGERRVRHTGALGCDSLFLVWWLKGKVNVQKVDDGSVGVSMRVCLLFAVWVKMCDLYDGGKK